VVMLSAVLLLPLAAGYTPGLAHAPRAGPVARTRNIFAADSSVPPDMSAIPPEQLGDAWRRGEKASELGDVLKGCSLYLIGFGPKRTTIGRVLAKRLGRYRAYDVSSLMCSTYKALSGGSDDVTLQQLLAKEPLADVEQLAYAILREVQPFSRTIVVGWEGAVAPADFAIMQQGIVVHLETEAEDSGAALPTEDADETLERWREGQQKADVTVKLAVDVAADDAAFQVVDGLLSFIAANPAKSADWKAQADSQLASNDQQGA